MNPLLFFCFLILFYFNSIFIIVRLAVIRERPIERYTLSYHGYLWVDEKHVQEKKENKPMYVKKPVCISFSMFVDLLTIDMN